MRNNKVPLIVVSVMIVAAMIAGGFLWFIAPFSLWEDGASTPYRRTGCNAIHDASASIH